MTPFTITPSDPPAKIFLPVLTTSGPAGLEVLAPQREVLLPGETTMIPLDWKL